MFFPRYFAMFDSCTTALFSQALGMKQVPVHAPLQVPGLPDGRHRARFLKPTKFGDDVVIETKVTAFRRSSFDVQHRLSLDGELCVECFDTRVWVERNPDDPDKIRAKPIPQEVIAKFASLGGWSDPDAMPEPQTRHPDHRRFRRHRRSAGAKMFADRP